MQPVAGFNRGPKGLVRVVEDLGSFRLGYMVRDNLFFTTTCTTGWTLSRFPLMQTSSIPEMKVELGLVKYP